VPKPNLPAPLAPRPEPGEQLLEAVRQRQPQMSLRLALQWVHRRGVHDLRRYCSGDLSAALGPEAVIWLEELLALEAPILSNSPALASTPHAPQVGLMVEGGRATAASGSLPGRRAVAPSEPEDLAEATCSAPTPWTGGGAEFAPAPPSGAEPQPLQEQPALEQELQARAEAAVDEAFAALAQSFQEKDATPAPECLPVAAEGTAPQSAPEPLPVRSGLWPSLRASAITLGSAFRPVDGEMTSPAHDLESSSSAPLLQEQSPNDSEAGAPSGPQPVVAVIGLDTTPASASESACPAPTDASEVPAKVQEEAGLLQRLRGRIRTGRLPRLSRLRAVMRDCVDETVALLRTPEPERNDDDGGFDLHQPLESAMPTEQQPSFSWSLDPLPLASPPPTASSDNPPPAPPSQASTSEANGAVSMPPRPSAASRLRFDLPVSKPAGEGDRPAPAPSGLSDLRAWLPDRGDLPRAS
jgi:hypothetical protein